MMWNKRLYYDYLKFSKNHKIHPVNIFDKIIEKCKKDKGKMGILYSEFMSDYDEAESFETADELRKYWTKDSNFKRLKNQDYGKLNMHYTYKTILSNRNAFNQLLIDITKEYASNSSFDINYFIPACQEVLKFQNSKFLQIDNQWNIKKQIKETFEYDIYDWSKNGYGDLKKLKNKKEYEFYLPEKQRNTLNLQLKQYKSKNLNLALRNMTVYTDLRQFFYSVKEEITA